MNKLKFESLLVLGFVCFLVGCSGGDSSGHNPNAAAKKPVLIERPTIPEQNAFSVSGPDGIELQVPPGAQGKPTEVLFEKGRVEDILEKGEKIISPVVRINLDGISNLQAKSMMKLRIPVSSTSLEQGISLSAKVRLSTGVVLPVLGVLNAEEKTYDLLLPALLDKWTLGVVAKKNVKLSNSAKGSFFATLGWLTEMSWETCEWTAVIHNDMSEEDVQEKILPDARSACNHLSKLGVRAPRLWIANLTEGTGRVLHIVNTASFFSSNPADEADDYLSNASEEEMLALGQMYISYQQYETLKQSHGISLGNILIHELFHGVQAGYDLRFGRQGNITSLKAYNEGTATPLGQTYQQYVSVDGPRAVARDLRNGEHMLMDEAVDSPWSNYYTKQSFFAYVANRWNRGSFSYVHQLYEQMAVRVYSSPRLAVNDYLPLYREGMDTAFKNEFGLGLSEVYFNFAEDRAFVHSPASKIHKIDTDMTSNVLAEELFGQEIQSIDHVLSGNSEVVYNDIAPLSMRAMKVLMPADLCTKDCPEENVLYLRINLGSEDVPLDQVKVVSYALDLASQTVIVGSRRELKKFDEPIPFSAPRGELRSFVVLIMNGSIGAGVLNFSAHSRGGISYVLPADVTTGDLLSIVGSGFGDEPSGGQVFCDQHVLPIREWTKNRIQVEIPPTVPTKVCQLFVRMPTYDTNSVPVNVRSTSGTEYRIYLDFDSKSISGRRISLPFTVKGNNVEFKYSESGRHGAENYQMSVSGTGTYDGKQLRISGNIYISTREEATFGNDLVVTTEEETMSFKNANGRWTMNIFFPGKTEHSSAHYIYHREEPKRPPTHWEESFNPDVEIWDWVL